MTEIQSDSPIFVIGSPRSGTTLLRLILTSHSYILIPPECGFIIWLKNKYGKWNIYDNKNRQLVNKFISDLFACKKFETWKMNKSIIEDMIINNNPQTYKELCFVIYAAFSASLGRNFTIWGDKNNFYLHHLNDLFSLWEKARFLHIVRDGRDVACSYREVMAEQSNSPYAPELKTSIVDIALEWSRNVEKIDSFMSTMSCESAMTIRYEDLVLSPKKTIKSICYWLNINYDNNMILFYEKNRNNNLEPNLTMDWKKRTLKPISGDTVKRYTSLLTKEEQSEFKISANHILKMYSYI